MSQPAKKLDTRTIGIATAAGAVVIVVAAQLLAKPELPPVAKSAPARGEIAAADGTTGQLRLAAEPPMRELFRPLVGRRPERSAAPIVTAPANAPRLPAPGAAKPSRSPAPAPAAQRQPLQPPAPSGPRVDDVQMLGVVVLGDQPQALLKKASTGESRYFAKGDDAFGFTVGEISETEVTLAREGRTERVTMSTAAVLEGPGSSGAVGSGPSSSSGSRSDSRGDRDSRREERREMRRESREGRGGGLASTDIMSLPNWTERLKKLEEIKSTMEPAQYERLKTFMTRRAEAEKK